MSAGALRGQLREAYGDNVGEINIQEAGRVMKDCHWIYEAAKMPKDNVIEVMATFPAIREGDVTERVTALVQAMTLGNSSGAVVGIGEKAGMRQLYDEVGIENGADLVEEQYPEGTYDPDRTKEPAVVAPPVPVAAPAVAAPGITPKPQPKSSDVKEAIDRLLAAVESAKPNGIAHR